MNTQSSQNGTNVCKLVTVKATGEIYLVQYQDHRAKLVYTWKNIVHYSGLKIQHEPGWIAHKEDDVEIEVVPYDMTLVKQLFDQAVELRRQSGSVIVRKGNKTFDAGPGLKSTSQIERRIQRWASEGLSPEFKVAV